MKDAKGHGSDPRGGSAHQQGVSQIGSATLGQGLDVAHSLGVNSEHIFTVTKGGEYVGEARLSHTGNYVVDLGVAPKFRNHGVASALYDHIEATLGHKLEPSPVYQTDAGKAFWKSRARK